MPYSGAWDGPDNLSSPPRPRRDEGASDESDPLVHGRVIVGAVTLVHGEPVAGCLANELYRASSTGSGRRGEYVLKFRWRWAKPQVTGWASTVCKSVCVCLRRFESCTCHRSASSARPRMGAHAGDESSRCCAQRLLSGPYRVGRVGGVPCSRPPGPRRGQQLSSGCRRAGPLGVTRHPRMVGGTHDFLAPTDRPTPPPVRGSPGRLARCVPAGRSVGARHCRCASPSDPLRSQGRTSSRERS